MVRPKSRKSVSRRSSILKAPVIQQSLQNVKDNVSLYQESSITIKQKRRVSFADKKHVKEFCDSVEQGTVWDITYEESSNENSGHINLNKQYNKNINKDNQDINDDRVTGENVYVMNNSLNLTETINIMGSSKQACVQEDSIKKSVPILSQNIDKNKDNHNILIESNANDICTDKSIIVSNNMSSVNDIENAALNKTCIEDVSMEITEIPHIIKCRNIAPILHKQLFEDKDNIPISNAVTNESNVLSILHNNMNKVSNQTRYSCTEQLEFTECVQSVMKSAELSAKLPKITPVANHEKLTVQKTPIFQDVPIQITCAIPSIDRNKFADHTMPATSTTNEKGAATTIDISEAASDKNKLLNASMEITNKSCPLSHVKTNDASSVVTDAVNILNSIHYNMYHNNNTQLNSDTMEFTIDVANLPPITESKKCTILAQTSLSTENTKIFQNESMEMTEVLHIPKIVNNNDSQLVNDTSINSIINNENFMSSKTQIFQNDSMEMTEVLHIPKIVHNNDIPTLKDIPLNPLINNENSMSSKTQIFQDESMAITVPLHTSQIIHNNDIPTLKDIPLNPLINNENSMSSKTQIFQDESMAITVPLHTSQIIHNNDIQKLNDVPLNPLMNNENSMSSKTQIFQDESMAITVPVHMSNILHNNDIQLVNNTSINSLVNNENLTSSRTQIFQDKSMTFTVPLHTRKIVHNNDIPTLKDIPLNPLINNENSMSSKTQIFKDESMAITVPLHTSQIIHNNDIQKLNDVPINPLRDNEDITSLDTRILQNMSMDNINAVTTLPILSNPSKSYESTEKDYVNSNINGKQDKAIVNNKTASEIFNDTGNSSAANCIGDFESSSTGLKVNALTSLISSFVYADMIEDASFVKAINENRLQSMENNIEEDTNCQKNNTKTKFTVNTIEVEMENIQFNDKCIDKNNEIIKEHECHIEREKNDQSTSKLFVSETIETNKDAFEKSINHKTICDISTEVEMVIGNKQLNETKKDFQKNSVTDIIKPKITSVIDLGKYTDDHSSNNQISDKSIILSPTLLSASNKNKMSIAESNLIANLTSNNNLNDFYEKDNCNNSSLNEDVGLGTLCEKPKEGITFQKGTFSSLVHELKIYMGSNDCIWDLYHEDIDKQMLVISFISTSLLIVIFTQNDVNTGTCPIKHINIISRLENDDNIQLSIAHKLIKEKIKVKYLDQLYKYDESVVPLLNDISEDVKLVLDFIFDLKQLDDTNIMEINIERIKFIVRSRYMNIVLAVTVDVKLFDEIDSSNVNIVCILGTVRKKDIKELIINIKRDHKFLRRFMSDIRGYIDIIEQADLANKKSYS